MLCGWLLEASNEARCLGIIDKIYKYERQMNKTWRVLGFAMT